MVGRCALEPHAPPQGFVLFPTRRGVGRVEPHLTTRLLLQHRRPSMVLPGHLPLVSDACNNGFQNILCLTTLFFLGSVSFSLISLRFIGVLWIVGPSSIPVQSFCGKVVLFIARSYFSGIFRIFRGLFELDLLL